MEQTLIRKKKNPKISVKYFFFFFFFFFLGQKPPHATEAFQLLPRRHLSLHHNGKDRLATETGAVEQTPVMWS